MNVLDKVVVVLAGTLLVCVASASPGLAAPERRACALLDRPAAAPRRVPVTRGPGEVAHEACQAADVTLHVIRFADGAAAAHAFRTPPCHAGNGATVCLRTPIYRPPPRENLPPNVVVVYEYPPAEAEALVGTVIIRVRAPHPIALELVTSATRRLR